MLYEIIDDVLTEKEIDSLLEKAIILCPAMKRENAPMHTANIKHAFPGCSIEFAILGRELLNDLAFCL